MKTYEELEELQHSDAEITLGMRSILGIFFALVLVCGVFFGFGYSLGRGNTGKTTDAAPTPSQALGTTRSSAVRTVVDEPAPSGANASANDPHIYVAGPGGPTREPAETALSPKPSAAPSSVREVSDAAKASPEKLSAPAELPLTRTSYNVSPPVRATRASYQFPAGPAIMVQIAAVSHREDADVLVAALKKLGYNASVRSEATDKLLHVQIGPFPAREEANLARTKLLNDGYNAILK